MKHHKKCQQCNSKFQTEDVRQKYCCHECYVETRKKDKTKKCLICHDKFQYNYKAQKTCSKTCADELRSNHKLSDKHKKQISEALKGKSFTKKHKERISKSLSGRQFTDEHIENLSKSIRKSWKNGREAWNKGIPIDPEVKKRMINTLRNGAAVSGEDHPHWKGGVNLKNRIRHMPEYREWREAVYERDNYTCQWCGDDTGGNLNADHHPKYFADIFHSNNISSVMDARNCDELWDIGNGRTLCESCHIETENYAIKYQTKEE